MANAISISGFTPSQLRVIKDTVAADTNNIEFDLFMEACRSYKLDPFRRQIHAVVYNKDKPEKRKMSIIVSRDGLRIVAQRCGDYRPASEPAEVVFDATAKGPTNPKGVVSATVRLWKQDRGGAWYPVIGEAYWEEFAPVREEWAFDQTAGKRQPTGRMALDQSGNWFKMPVLMLTKCAESQALRAGWPGEFGSLYSEEEMDRLAVETTASAELEEYAKQEREAKLGGPGIMLIFDDTMVMQRVALGHVVDRCLEYIAEAGPAEVHAFAIRNTASLQDFWAHDKNGALEIKRAIESKEAAIHSADDAPKSDVKPEIQQDQAEPPVSEVAKPERGEVDRIKSRIAECNSTNELAVVAASEADVFRALSAPWQGEIKAAKDARAKALAGEMPI